MASSISSPTSAYAYPELVWALGSLNIHPDMVDIDYMDSWFCYQGLDSREIIPAIPPAYNREHEERRALYVLGFPPLFTPVGMRNFFSSFTGVEVEKCIAVVDVISQCSFRWVVLTTERAADFVISECQHLILSDPDEREYTLRICKSFGPRSHFRLNHHHHHHEHHHEHHHDPVPAPAPLPAPLRVSVPAPTCAPIPLSIPAYVPRVLETRERVVFEGTNPNPATPKAQQLPRIIETVHGHPSPPEKSPVHSTPPRRALVPVYEPDSDDQKTPTSRPRASRPWRPEDDIENAGLGDDDEASTPTISTLNKTPPQIFVTQAASWAAIANTANPNAQLINLHPGKQNNRLRTTGRIPQVVAYGDESESHVDQIRVVFLLDLPSNITTQDVSDAVREGPLRSISFGFDDEKQKRFAGVVFHHAADAELFHSVLVKERAESKPDRFKFVVEAVRGEPFPCDEYLKLMGPPTYASRRLTIVKSRFFFMFGERQLKALCEKLVGSDSVQLIWLYNGGNATIVFADVPSAVTVKNALDRMAAGIGLPSGQAAATWDGLQTTFSKDPCAVPLELKTAMN